jgi:hypothetical protein
VKKASDELQRWVVAKRQCGLSDAHVQMARELEVNPKRLTRRSGAAGLTGVPLAQHIEELYLRRFKRTIPDPVVSLRQLLRETLARERTEARERRRRKRQAEKDHLEAMRISMLTLRHMYGGIGADDDCSGWPRTASK